MSLTHFRSADQSAPATRPSRVTIQTLQDKKSQGTPIVALTAYDYATARLVDEAGVDIILVGDSLAMVVMGYDNTLPVTMDEMLLHTRAVRRAVKHAMVVADMPFGSYQVSTAEGVANAARFLKEAGAQAVKIEGGASRLDLVKRLTDAEIPVVAHLGLTPQSVHRMSGYRVQGKSVAAIHHLVKDALALEAAGAFAVVLEGIPAEVAQRITAALAHPDHRHRRRAALRWADPGAARSHQSVLLPSREIRPPLRRRRGLDHGCGPPLSQRRGRSAISPAKRKAIIWARTRWRLCSRKKARPGARPSDMLVLKTIAETRSACARIRAAGKTLGLVPTMGALHQGHLSLVRAAQASCDAVAVSIFVNPTQFGPKEDFAGYPRSLEQDCRTLEAAGVDLVFAPSVEEMYPPGASTFVEVAGLSDRLDGASRPGHFRGVATVVAKLLHIFAPDRAFFGQKDAAQVAVLRKMVRDLQFAVQLDVCPTVREPDGLAMSSRNRNLSDEQRRQALVLSRALLAVQQQVQGGEHDSGKLIAGGLAHPRGGACGAGGLLPHRRS